jgi:uncharacterized protein
MKTVTQNTVTESNRAVIASVMEALAQGNTRPFGDAMADDFTWHMIGTTPWSGTFAGKAEVRQRLITPLFAQFATQYKNAPKRILADGDFVIVECRGDVITKRGKPYRNSYCYVIQMREGKMVELTEYFDTELVRTALEPPPWAA